jgi:hypothetical protein
MALGFDKSINPITGFGVDALFFISHQVVAPKGRGYHKKNRQNETNSLR